MTLINRVAMFHTSMKVCVHFCNKLGMLAIILSGPCKHVTGDALYISCGTTCGHACNNEIIRNWVVPYVWYSQVVFEYTIQ